jgi:hypothetical protein
MRAQLKRLHSPDVLDLPRYWPDEPDTFGFLLQMMVGPEGIDGEESLDVVVCTARWLEQRYADRDIVPLAHHLLVREYDYPVLLRALTRLVERCVGDDWDGVARQVARIGWWEFEGYTPYGGPR